MEQSFYDKYTLKEALGRGAFSLVKLGVNNKTGEQVAVKIIEKKNVSNEYKKNLDAETEILRRVQHKNIVRVHEVVDTPNFLFIVMELLTGGELFDRIVDRGCYTEQDAAELIRKIVEAIDYLHSVGICHRDLKPENLLLASKENDVDVKIGDFGLSKIIAKSVMMQTACGTPGYVAPEVLAATGYDKEVDLWSIGVITYILLCGFPPFYGDSVPVLFEQIMQGNYDYPMDYWGDVSAEAIDFIDRLLVVDKDKRMTAAQALKHPWLNGKANATVKLDVGKSLKSSVGQRRAQSSSLFAGDF